MREASHKSLARVSFIGNISYDGMFFQLPYLAMVVVEVGVVILGLVVGFGATIRMFFWSMEGSVAT